MLFAICLLFAICSATQMDSTGLTAQEEKAKPGLSLKLEATKPAITAGTAPVLRLTLENVGKADEKILKPRGDLQNTYYRLVVTKEGNALTGASDFRSWPNDRRGLPDTETWDEGYIRVFRYAVAVHDLPPGKYQAQIFFGRIHISRILQRS